MYRKGYILYGDLEAKCRGGHQAQKTGEKSESRRNKEQSYIWRLGEGISHCPKMTSDDRFLSDVLNIAQSISTSTAAVQSLTSYSHLSIMPSQIADKGFHIAEPQEEETTMRKR